MFGVAGDRTFHPKVAMLTRGASPSADYTVLVGSQNWTPGGLDSNFEVGVRLDLRQFLAGQAVEFVGDVIEPALLRPGQRVVAERLPQGEVGVNTGIGDIECMPEISCNELVHRIGAKADD